MKQKCWDCGQYRQHGVLNFYYISLIISTFFENTTFLWSMRVMINIIAIKVLFMIQHILVETHKIFRVLRDDYLEFFAITTFLWVTFNSMGCVHFIKKIINQYILEIMFIIVCVSILSCRTLRLRSVNVKIHNSHKKNCFKKLSKFAES